MKKGIIIPLLLALVCLFASCGQSYKIKSDSQEDVIDFYDNGFSNQCPHILIDNYKVGKRADITFLINNKSNQDIDAQLVKVFNVNPENDPALAGMDYQSIPPEYTDWIVIPRLAMIPIGKSARYTMTIQIPKGIELPRKWAFVVWASSGLGGFPRVDFGVWIVVNMR